jgi:hypothetical protein
MLRLIKFRYYLLLLSKRPIEIERTCIEQSSIDTSTGKSLFAHIRRCKRETNLIRTGTISITVGKPTYTYPRKQVINTTLIKTENN